MITLAFVILQLPLLNISGTINTVQAQGNEGKTYTLLEPLPCLTGAEVGCVGGKGGEIKNINLGDFFQYAFNLLIALSAVAAVFIMVYGGFLYMTTDSWQQSKAGLEKFKNAIYGLLMVLSAFLILKTVNPKLVAIPASIAPIDVPESMKQSPTALFDQLNQESAQYRANLQSVKSNIIWDQELIAGFDEDIEDVEDEIMSLSYDPLLTLTPDDACKGLLKRADDPEMYDLCAKRTQLLLQKKDVTMDIDLQVIKGISDSQIWECSPMGDPEKCDTALENLGKATEKYYMNNLKSFSEEQIKQSANYILYSKATVGIIKQQALVYQTTGGDTLDWVFRELGVAYKESEFKPLITQQEASYKAIDKIVSDYAATPNYDPELLKQLQEKQKIAKQDIKNAKFHLNPK